MFLQPLGFRFPPSFRLLRRGGFTLHLFYVVCLRAVNWLMWLNREISASIFMHWWFVSFAASWLALFKCLKEIVLSARLRLVFYILLALTGSHRRFELSIIHLWHWLASLHAFVVNQSVISIHLHRQWLNEINSHVIILTVVTPAGGSLALNSPKGGWVLDGGFD